QSPYMAVQSHPAPASIVTREDPAPTSTSPLSTSSTASDIQVEATSTRPPRSSLLRSPPSEIATKLRELTSSTPYSLAGRRTLSWSSLGTLPMPKSTLPGSSSRCSRSCSAESYSDPALTIQTS